MWAQRPPSVQPPCACGRGRAVTLLGKSDKPVGAWRRVPLLVALLAPFLYGIKVEGERTDAALFVEETCGGLCEQQYIQRLNEADPRFGERVASFMCPYRDKYPTSEAEMVICASPGTTGTRSLARYLADGCNMMVHHWQVAMCPGDPHVYWDTLLGAEYVAFNNESMTTQELDAFMEENDLVGHVLEPLSLISSNGELQVSAAAILDDPVDRMFYDLYRQFPKAKFVVLDRPAAEWRASRLSNHAGELLQVPILRAPASWHLDAWPETVIFKVYEALAELVKCLVPPERLAVTGYFPAGDNTTVELEAKLQAFLAPERNCSILAQAGIKPPKFSPFEWPPVP